MRAPEPALIDALGASERSIGALDEFAYIAVYLARARAEIAALGPREIEDGRLKTAGAQLEAIVRDTEAATNAIMAAAEAILALQSPTREEIAAEMSKIFVACSFQDITGQRVRKVVDALSHVEARVGRFADAMGLTHAGEPGAAAPADEACAGPGLYGPHTDQAGVDNLISTQGDIDTLFDRPRASLPGRR